MRVYFFPGSALVLRPSIEPAGPLQPSLPTANSKLKCRQGNHSFVCFPVTCPSSHTILGIPKMMVADKAARCCKLNFVAGHCILLVVGPKSFLEIVCANLVQGKSDYFLDSADRIHFFIEKSAADKDN